MTKLPETNDRECCRPKLPQPKFKTEDFGDDRSQVLSTEVADQSLNFNPDHPDHKFNDWV